MNKKITHPRLERWVLRLAIYEFEIRFKPGHENIVANALSRLFDENDINENPDDDFFDILIAAIEPITTEEDYETVKDHQYLEEIEMVPNSQQMKSQTAKDQDQDKEINWIKRLILENSQARPTISEFETPEQKVFFKQYSSLRVVDGILYRQQKTNLA